MSSASSQRCNPLDGPSPTPRDGPAPFALSEPHSANQHLRLGLTPWSAQNFLGRDLEAPSRLLASEDQSELRPSLETEKGWALCSLQGVLERAKLGQITCQPVNSQLAFREISIRPSRLSSNARVCTGLHSIIQNWVNTLACFWIKRPLCEGLHIVPAFNHLGQQSMQSTQPQFLLCLGHNAKLQHFSPKTPA